MLENLASQDNEVAKEKRSTHFIFQFLDLGLHQIQHDVVGEELYIRRGQRGGSAERIGSLARRETAETDPYLRLSSLFRQIDRVSSP